MNEHEVLARAISIASDAHHDQFDKSGKPYILHPLEVMRIVQEKYGYDPILMAIAVLHDVVEDTFWTFENLLIELENDRVGGSLLLLTRDEDESYKEFIGRIVDSGNLDAMRVKMVDLQHNSDLTRLKGVSDKDFSRSKKYMKSFFEISAAHDKWLRRSYGS